MDSANLENLLPLKISQFTVCYVCMYIYVLFFSLNNKDESELNIHAYCGVFSKEIISLKLKR